MMPYFQLLNHKLFCAYYICLIYLVSLWYVILQNLTAHRNPKISHQKGRVALVTGGGRGIGYETSCQLLKAGMTVIIVDVRDQKEIINLKKKYKDHVKFLSCDLSSLKAVRQLAAKFTALNLPLHLLVNNAGIMFAPQTITSEGFESHWAINYLSHFFLTHLLLPILVKSASNAKPSRIVNLGSCLHYPGSIDFNDINGKSCYSAEFAYTQSKLAMVMFASCLARHLHNKKIPVLINSVHPAVAFSGLYKHVWWADVVPNFARNILNTPAKGSDTVVHAAISDEVIGGGSYYENCQVKTPSKEAQSRNVQDKLWKLSCSQTGIKDFSKFHD